LRWWKPTLNNCCHYLIVLSLFLSSTVFANDLLIRAEQLINSGQAQQAYDLLISEAEERSGNPDFDLLLGIAALDSGHPSQAVFALERVLAIQPNNSHAHAELARAYFEMGENEAAKEEFTAVNKQQVPASISATIDKYLSEIEARFASMNSRFSAYIEGTIGYDSNVNSATDTSTVAIPALGNLLFTLDATGREIDSGFFELGAGLGFYTPFLGRDDVSIFGAINLHERVTFTEPDFRSRIADGQVGLSFTQGKNQYRASILGQRFNFSGDVNREQAGGSLQWLYSYDERTQLSAFAQAAIQRFPGQRIRDVNQYSAGFGVVRGYDREGQPVVFASVFAGTDDELADLRPDLGRDFVGIRLGGQYTLNEKMQLQGNFSYQYARYGADDPLFQKRRRDHFIVTRLGLNYSLTKSWYVLPEVQYLNNDSSLVINDFNRWQLFVNVRNNF
jgi:outer membrane protein